jgi:hypothetical protein
MNSERDSHKGTRVCFVKENFGKICILIKFNTISRRMSAGNMQQWNCVSIGMRETHKGLRAD